MVANEPGVLEQLTAKAAEMVNTGPLEKGEEVEVVVDGRMQRAKVRAAVSEVAMFGRLPSEGGSHQPYNIMVVAMLGVVVML